MPERLEHPTETISFWTAGSPSSVPDPEARHYLPSTQHLSSKSSVMNDPIESQARRQALSDVRDAAIRMVRPGASEEVERSVETALRVLGIPFHACGVNHVTPDAPPRRGGSRDSELRGLEIIYRIWESQQVAYRPDVLDLFGEAKAHADDYGAPVRTIVDVPFSHGTLAVNSTRPDAFSQAHIAELQALAEALSEGVRLGSLEH
jgi:hypothetical protein